MIPKIKLILMSTTRCGGSDDSLFAETLLLRWNEIVLIYEQVSFTIVPHVYMTYNIILLDPYLSIVNQIAKKKKCICPI